MKKIIISNASHILFVIVILIQLFAFVRIQWLPNTIAPEGHVAINNKDDLYYISEIRQIKNNGGWKFIEPHTTRPIIPVVVYGLYIIGGKIAALFNTDPTLMYVLLRIIGSLAASIATYIFIIKVLPKSLHTLGVLFTFCVETVPLFTDIFTKPFYQWTAAVSNRVIIAQQFEAAHHRFGEACAVLLLIIFFTKTRITYKTGIIIVLLTTMGTIFSPSILAVFSLAIYIPYAIVTYIQTRDLRRMIPIILSLFVMGILSIWMKYEFGKGQPLNTFYNFESSWFSNSSVLTLYTLSTVVYLFWIFLYVIAGKRRNSLPLLMVLWIILPAIFIIVKPLVSIDFLPVANWRIAWGVPTIPFAILATLGAEALGKIFKTKRYIGVGILIIYFSFSFLLSVQFVKNIETSLRYNNYPQMYPFIYTWKGIQFLDTLPKLTGVLTAPYYGEIIPAYATVRTFIGQPLSYIDWQERNILSYNFFSGIMATEEARMFLKNNDISYVFFGPEEQAYHGSHSPIFPSLLTPVYETSEITIYKVL